ncbi:MAG: DUF7149 domain-containing protein, partial [Brevinema sp.]
MELDIISIKEFLKKNKLTDYYIADKDQRIGLFQERLETYRNTVQGAIDKKESEEHFKSIFNDFLKDSYQYHVNTHRRIDSVITSDKNIKTIIEVKRPQNTNEYITAENANSKALHEILLYYYELRQDNIYTVNHIIISDCQTLYLFNAKEFEAMINDKTISSLLSGYKNKELAIINKTSDFYDEVSKLINDLGISLEACKIDLFDESLEIE